MSCYYNKYRDMLVLKCDACGKQIDLYKGSTDRLDRLLWERENAWKTKRMDNGKWADYCKECLTAVEEKKRQAWVETIR